MISHRPEINTEDLLSNSRTFAGAKCCFNVILMFLYDFINNKNKDFESKLIEKQRLSSDLSAQSLYLCDLPIFESPFISMSSPLSTVRLYHVNLTPWVWFDPGTDARHVMRKDLVSSTVRVRGLIVTVGLASTSSSDLVLLLEPPSKLRVHSIIPVTTNII